MKVINVFLLFLVLAGLSALGYWQLSSREENETASEYESEENDPDLPPGVKVNREQYLTWRSDNIALLRGIDTAKQDSRTEAVRKMEQAEREQRAQRANAIVPTWRFLGPAPLPNGQTVGRTDPVSGRTISLAVHPTNPSIVYAGTAQGGLYRSLNGGTTWTPLMDGALTLEIGSIAIAPSNPSTIYIGTGEAGFCGDCFFGVGVYRIDNADSLTPTVSGPFNKDAGNNDIFTTRAIGKVLVHPTDPNTIYVTSASGTAGIHGSTGGAVFPARGLYRSTNATTASPVFERLTVSATSADRPMLDAVFEPGNPNRMFVTLVDSQNLSDGGVYFSSNALDAAPTWTRVMTTANGNEAGRAELAIQKTGNTVTVFCAHGTSSGQVSKAVYDSTAPGTPNLTLSVDNNFCSGQCFYDIAIDVDPTDPMKVYLAGSPTLPFGRSTNGGTSFTSSSTGLHVDSHAIAVAPSDVNTIYFGSDGGVWKSTDGGTNWVSQNNTTFSATQFVALAVHPNDRHYTLGGTQDNGTPYLFPDGSTWTRAVGGDGGHVVIDSNSASPTSLVSYHTFFSQTNNQIGFARSTTTQANGQPIYGGLMGCSGGVSNNGILCSDATLFYAPLVLGPNAAGSMGNTVYFGSNKLYRSVNQGTLMTAVSQTLPGANERVSTIAISPQNDDIRLIGSTTGRVYYSNTAAAVTMTDITGTIPARLIGRARIHPTNPDIAYVTLGGFGVPGQHVMKTTNLSSVTPTWTNAGNGIPDVPTNGLVIDSLNPETLYAGTDIGVFQSTDGGANWVPFSDNLPKVAVFQIEMQPTSRVLKIATHGRGIWEYNFHPRRVVADFDGDAKTDVSVFRPSGGDWYISRSSDGGFAVIHFGTSGDVITPGDYDADGKTDVAIFRTGTWYVLNSGNSTVRIENFGIATDKPVAHDYDGDQRTDLAVYRDGAWYYLRSGNSTINAVSFGIATDTPIPSDYDGDGKADIAVYRGSDNPTDTDFFILKSSDSAITGYSWGISTDVPVSADYDGDGKSDAAVYRPSDGNWYVVKSTGGFIISHFGVSTDLPQHGDYDGDGMSDLAVYRPSEGNWYVLRSSTGTSTVQTFGLATDVPVPAKHNP